MWEVRLQILNIGTVRPAIQSKCSGFTSWMASGERVLGVSSLPPQQQCALSVLSSNLERWESLMSEDPLTVEDLKSDFLRFSYHRFERLPHGMMWGWSQSAGKVKVQLTPDTFVTLWKMHARKNRRNRPEKPTTSILWLYDIVSPHTPDNLYLLWCERGPLGSESKPASADPNTGPFASAPVTLPALQPLCVDYVGIIDWRTCYVERSWLFG